MLAAKPDNQTVRSTPCHTPLRGRQRDLYFGIFNASGGRPPQSGCPNAGSHLHLHILRLVHGTLLLRVVNRFEPNPRLAAVLQFLIIATAAAAIASRFMH